MASALRFAANVSMLFTDAPFLARLERAARAGFTAVECQFPYDVAPQVLKHELDAHGLTLVLHNLPPGNWDAGERGIACHPDRRDEFRAAVQRGLEYATALGCPRVNCLAGLAPAGVDLAQAHDTLAGNLAYAAEQASAAGVTLLLEPINTGDMPGYLVSTAAAARTVMRAVNSPHLRLQFDAYHAQVMDGDAVATLSANLEAIGHVQVADAPGRHEPGTGTIDFPALFALLDEAHYSGWIGCEYRPAGRTEDGLQWMRHAGHGRRVATN